MKDVMLDLETLGTRPGCAVLSIGACTFSPTGHGTDAEFYANIDPQSCRDAGLYVDPATVEWWSRQGDEAKAALMVDRRPLKDALWAFATWWQTVGGERVWSQGAAFDQPILEAAFVAAGFAGAPWAFWNSRCSRTLFAVADVDARHWKGAKHNALEDARAQAGAVQAAMAVLFPDTDNNPNDGVFS